MRSKTCGRWDATHKDGCSKDDTQVQTKIAMKMNLYGSGYLYYIGNAPRLPTSGPVMVRVLKRLGSKTQLARLGQRSLDAPTSATQPKS